MRCQRCATENHASNLFCGACGCRLEIACARCGRSYPAPSEFCRGCGAALQQPPEQREARGERKQATILFADIVGSTHLIANLDAEEGMARLRPVLAAMAHVVQRFEGSIIQRLGDGLLVAFGAPRAQEGHALLACRAALAMQEAVAALPSAPPIRIGLHSGEVVVGEFDTGSAIERATIGATLHFASRIEQLAKPGSVLLSQACWRLVRAYCDTEALGPHSLKGFDEPVEVYRLIGLKPAVASEQFREASLPPLVGRDAEMALLQNAQAEAERGNAAVIGISAPPGMGKSRLCYEFSEWCRRRQIEVPEARALAYAHATPLQAVLEMVRSFLRLSPLDRPHDARQKIAHRLLALDPSFEADLPLLNDFLGVSDPECSAPPLGPHARHVRLREIFRRIVAAAGKKPSVIVIDDLHWLDAASADYMETLIDAAIGTRAMVVVNFRPPYRADWMARPEYREVALGELGPADTHGLVGALIGGRPELFGLREQIAERSSGNPFFAEELVRSLEEGGILLGERGSYELGAPPNTAGLPATVEAVLGERMDRLPEREKALLQIGATIGREFPATILITVAAADPGGVEALLARLVDSSLIRKHQSFAGPGFAFKHPLIQEVCYAMQLRAGEPSCTRP